MMFNKDTVKLKSFLGSHSEFQGELKAKGILRMDGAVTGKLEADEVILSKTAEIKGNIVANRIIVGGKVEGSLRALNLVEIRPEGSVKGEIYTNRLLVMKGGEINGKIEMKAEEPTVLEFESQNQEAALS